MSQPRFSCRDSSSVLVLIATLSCIIVILVATQKVCREKVLPPLSLFPCCNFIFAKDFKHKKGEDYDTFAPMRRISSIRVLIFLASIHNLVIHHMDVKITFLNGELEEEIYMDKPKRCMVPKDKQKICRLVKSLYGLK